MTDTQNFGATLAVINGPYILLQTLWYYAKHTPKEKWIALVINFDDEAYMHKMKELCEASGIFSEVLLAQSGIRDESAFRKIKTILAMGGRWVIGQKKKYCANLLKTDIGDRKIDKALIPYDYSVTTGAIMNVLPEGQIVLLEDGLGDYKERGSFPRCNPYSILGFILSRMGYMNVYINGERQFTFEPDRKCIKYANMPDKMVYRNFLGIEKLFAREEADAEAFQKLIEKTFLSKEEIKIDDIDVVLFSAPLDAYDTDSSNHYEKIHAWLKENRSGEHILIKKHPMDKYDYDWKDLNISIGYDSVPGECFVGYGSQEKEILLMFPSTMLISLQSGGCDCKIFGFPNLSNENYHTNVKMVNNVMGIEEDRYINV
ncbi:MAG: alpha-2,8-polysialyltransferase family protein [Lachnospiraceae bacterium]|nr:alpha-2,8-polysialyltransferase family protein [Lachnospiraceae bacterium]